MSADARNHPYPQSDTLTTRSTLLADALTDTNRRGELAQRYAAPVYWAYFGFYRTRPQAREEAEELMHGFLIHFFLDDALRFAEYLTGCGPRGRFLHYVLAAADRRGGSSKRRPSARSTARFTITTAPGPRRTSTPSPARTT